MLTRVQWIIVLVLGGVALALNLGNLWLGAKLKEESSARQAATGMQLGEMAVFNLDSLNPGQLQTESFRSDRVQLLFLISPTCVFCRDNLVYWQEIEAQWDPEQIRFLAITQRTGSDNALYQDGLRTPILLTADPQALHANRLLSTPQTILIDADGKVLHNWRGVLQEERQEINRALTLLTK